mmetsp:Transcript_20024/g.37408  ORF Transcript_20024/g.37408 Transcript_20024/m.37408 type:complete len:92 (+) Transcript_20024:222-497(+)
MSSSDNARRRSRSRSRDRDDEGGNKPPGGSSAPIAPNPAMFGGNMRPHGIAHLPSLPAFASAGADGEKLWSWPHCPRTGGHSHLLVVLENE